MESDKLNEKKPFDYKKDKEFEEKTNKLHFPNVQKFIKGDDWFTYLTEIADLEEQKKGIDLKVYKHDRSQITVELKTDRHINSPNLFLEDVSNYKTKKLGWTMKCEADLLSYGFYDKKCDCLTRQFIMDMPRVKKWFWKNRVNYEEKHIKNKGYNAMGRAVPIEDLKEFILWDMESDKPKPEIRVHKLGDFM